MTHHINARNRALAQRNGIYALLVVLADEQALAKRAAYLQELMA